MQPANQGRDRALAFGVWGAVNGAAAAAGPIIGGLLTQALSWRWVFFVNLPVSVLAIAVSARVLTGERRLGGGRIDIPGVLAFTVAAGAVTAAITRASDNGWTSTSTLGLLSAGAAAALAFVAIEARIRRPVLELALLRRASFAGVLAAALLYSIAAFAYLAYESLWLQSVRGMSPVQTGLALTPLALSALIVSLAAGRWLQAVDARWRIAGGLALIGAGAISQAHLDAGSSWRALLPGLVVTGIRVGLATAALATAALATFMPRRARAPPKRALSSTTHHRLRSGLPPTRWAAMRRGSTPRSTAGSGIVVRLRHRARSSGSRGGPDESNSRAVPEGWEDLTLWTVT